MSSERSMRVRRRVRRAAGVVLAVALVAAAPVPQVTGPVGACDGTDRGAVDTIPACGTVVLEGAGGSWLTLVVDAPTRVVLSECAEGTRHGVPTGDACSVDGVSDGPLAGFVLVDPVQRGTAAGVDHPGYLMIVETTAAEWASVNNAGTSTRGMQTETENGRTYVPLAPGEYALHLIAQGDEDRVEITFDGPTGSVTATPTRTTMDYTFVVPQNQLPDTPNAWSAGTVFATTGTSLTFYTHVADSPVNQPSVQGSCAYEEPIDDPLLAFQPGCPEQVTRENPEGSGSFPFVNPTLTLRENISIVRPAGQWAMGSWQYGVAPVAFVGNAGFALRLE